MNKRDDIMKNNLYKRSIQIDGSYSNDTDKQIVEFSHSLVKLISKSLFIKDTAIVSLVGKEDCVFYWDILETAYEYAKYMKFSDKTKNIVIVISSEKNLKYHIPANRKDLWENLIEKEIVYLKHIGNINSGEFKRREQEEFSNALLILGGGEGVESSAKLHISHKKPVLALDIPLGCSNRSTGSGGAPSIYKKSIEDPMKYFFRDDIVSKIIHLSYERWSNNLDSYANKILEFLGLIIKSSTNSETLRETEGRMKMEKTKTGLELRIRQLEDNIRNDLKLLNEYEEILRLSNDPKEIQRCKNEIEKLRKSVDNNKEEYDELKKEKTIDEPVMKSIGHQFQLIDTKLDKLVTGQQDIQNNITDLHQSLFDRFDANEQNIIKTIIDHLDKEQIIYVQRVLDAIADKSLSDHDMQEILDMMKNILSDIHQLKDTILVRYLEQLPDVIDDPKLDVSHKLKVTIPIIPLLLSYEGFIELKNGMNLYSLRKKILEIFPR